MTSTIARLKELAMASLLSEAGTSLKDAVRGGGHMLESQRIIYLFFALLCLFFAHFQTIIVVADAI